MALIKSISGIRGTIGGKPGDGLKSARCCKVYSCLCNLGENRKKTSMAELTIVVGRDARISGPMVSSLVISTLTGMGCNVVNIGLASTPTTEIAVTEENGRWWYNPHCKP
jgi:phosphomannomutase